MSASRARIATGTVFAREFRVTRFLAAGGMGAVYVADQLSTGKERALKVMHDPLVDEDGSRRARFLREARVSAGIESDHVIEVLAAGVDDDTGIPWLAMELLKGQDLAKRLKEKGPLAPADVLEVFRQLCHGLGAAHRAGLVHRDMKPDNVFLAHARRDDVPYTVKILDFGLATAVRGENSGDLTTGLVAGSPMWMAPEQANQQHPISPATDVWALGLMAFRLLTGRYYWRNANRESGSVPAVLGEMLMEPLEPASMRARELDVEHLWPASLDEWFSRCVQRDPEARFRSAALAMMALTPVLEAESARAGVPRPRRGTGTNLRAANISADGITADRIDPNDLRSDLSLPLPPQPEPPAPEFPPPPPRLGNREKARADRSRKLMPVLGLLVCVAGVAGGYFARERFVAIFRYVHQMVNPIAAPNVDLRESEVPTAQGSSGARAPVTPLVPGVPSAQLNAVPPQIAPVRVDRDDAALARRLERTHACLRRFNYGCAATALAGHGNTEEELSLVVTVARGQRRNADARRAMQTYVERYPAGPRADEYRMRILNGT